MRSGSRRSGRCLRAAVSRMAHDDVAVKTQPTRRPRPWYSRTRLLIGQPEPARSRLKQPPLRLRRAQKLDSMREIGSCRWSVRAADREHKGQKGWTRDAKSRHVEKARCPGASIRLAQQPRPTRPLQSDAELPDRSSPQQKSRIGKQARWPGLIRTPLARFEADCAGWKERCRDRREWDGTHANVQRRISNGEITGLARAVRRWDAKSGESHQVFRPIHSLLAQRVALFFAMQSPAEAVEETMPRRRHTRWHQARETSQ
jgi:hypothetical protein